jgi:HEAT repeat protein
LAQLARHSDPRVRSDAAHFLALSGNKTALGELEALVQDSEPAVRELARDSLAELQEQLEK